MSTVDVKVPDIGDFKDVGVIEILVKPGDAIKAEQSLITVESDKASMEIPSSAAGVVKELKVQLGDKVSQGAVILSLEMAAEADAGAAPAQRSASADGGQAAPVAPIPISAAAQLPSPQPSSQPRLVEVRVPDIGDFHDVGVIEVFVQPGDTVKLEQSLITVESDKASMEIPSDAAGVIQELKVKLGDKVNQGDLLVIVQSAGAALASAVSAPATVPAEAGGSEKSAAPVQPPAQPVPAAAQAVLQVASLHQPGAAPAGLPYASPSVRKFARELGVPLAEVKGSAAKGRITQADVQAFTRAVMAGLQQTQAQVQQGAGGALPGLLQWPQIDFAKFGPIAPQPLSRIQKISGANLHRNWVMIPHVTNNDEADITDLETLRARLNKENEKSGIKVTMLAFVIKAVVAALKKFPEFNASLDGDKLVLKRYYHIGFAADTPNGLMVPVLKDADRKGVLQIAQESAELAKKAREGKLAVADMQGGCFSISSLGGIGGTHFTPIINAPEVAILGLSRACLKPVWDGKAFAPRLTLPLSLSYDHRVIDGAAAARFNAYLTALLADLRRIVL
ncbi:MAG: dihydrolipoyllysine-residue acetyltransferase [Burkholderiaceae bacterium]|jgi:pyruvate dehydrogenase E2 component (dihydrolipoamide acetyltransferase)|nr:dihydrolipoyllysine-residue acetyltransferase [Burkholderiaceae bacterium]